MKPTDATKQTASRQPNLAQRLENARRQLFVGRQKELEIWRFALGESGWPRPLWHLSGLGGIGKSTLLREMASLAREARVRVWWLDARDIEATPEAFTRALGAVSQNQWPFAETEISEEKTAIFVDTFEKIAALEGWLQSEFLPQLPQNCAFVAAGRAPLSLGFRGDAAWSALWQTFELRALDAEATQLYLQKRDVNEDACHAIGAFAQGHPLALSLATDLWVQNSENANWQRPLLPFLPSPKQVQRGVSPFHTPELVGTLLSHLVVQAPSKWHAQVLEACATLHVCTEEVLGEVVDALPPDGPNLGEIFAWLRSLSFIQSSERGVFPHDLVRELLLQDLRWRNPSWQEEMHRRARQFYARRVHEVEGVAQERIVFDSIFLHRESPVVGPFLHWGEQPCALDRARRDEWPLLLEAVERFEGAESRAIAQMWFEAQPENLVVARDGAGKAQGFILQLALQSVTSAQAERDVGVKAALQFLRHNAPLRGGESATFFRFWLSCEGYQEVSAPQSLIFVQAVRHYLTKRNLAFTFFACADPDFWREGFLYADLERLPTLDFSVGGKNFGVYGHDWRARPVLDWLDLMMQREIRAAGASPSSPASANTEGEAPALLGVLGEAAFRGEVCALLKNPGALTDSPLLDCTFVRNILRANPALKSRTQGLQLALSEAHKALAKAPRCENCSRALELRSQSRFLSQEAAAVHLNVSLSTFRRALKAGEAFIAEHLWQLETGHQKY